jgi:hypothetical protein
MIGKYPTKNFFGLAFAGQEYKIKIIWILQVFRLKVLRDKCSQVQFG